MTGPQFPLYTIRVISMAGTSSAHVTVLSGGHVMINWALAPTTKEVHAKNIKNKLLKIPSLKMPDKELKSVFRFRFPAWELLWFIMSGRHRKRIGINSLIGYWG